MLCISKCFRICYLVWSSLRCQRVGKVLIITFIHTGGCWVLRESKILQGCKYQWVEPGPRPFLGSPIAFLTAVGSHLKTWWCPKAEVVSPVFMSLYPTTIPQPPTACCVIHRSLRGWNTLFYSSQIGNAQQTKVRIPVKSNFVNHALLLGCL